MTQLFDIGNRYFADGNGVATLDVTPIAGRAIMVNRIRIVNPSANDNWTISVGNREIMRIPVNTTGNQQFFGQSSTNYPKTNDFFEWFNDAFDDSFEIPVPEGITLEIKSVGGATANVVVEGYEVTTTTPQSSMRNYYLGSRFTLPVFAYINAAVANAGEVNFDSMIKPPWVPALLLNNSLPVGWQMRLRALWIETGGVNTYSGAVNHQSNIDYLFSKRNGQRLYTRNNTGIPAIGAASAAGAISTVFGSVGSNYPAFQLMRDNDEASIEPASIFSGGDLIEMGYHITGDVTGGANYAGFLTAALIDIQYTAGNPVMGY